MSVKRIVNNTIISLLGQVVTWASTFFLMIAYGRFLGDFKFGELYFALTFVLLLGILIDSGYDNQITRGVAEEPERTLHYFSNVLLIKLCIWPVVYAFALLLSWLLGYSGEVRILVGICGLTLLSMSITNTFASLHYAYERAVFPVIGNILEKGLAALIGFIILRNGASVQAMALVLLGGSMISCTWQSVWFFRLVGRRFVIDLALIRRLVKANLPFLIYGVLGVLYYRIDTVLLSLMTNITVVGWYGASYRLFDTLNFLPNLVLTILYPVLSKLSLSSDKDLKLAAEKAVNFLLFCGIPIAVVMIVAAPNIIGFLFHRAEFSHSVPALQALAPGVIFLYLNTALGSLILSKKQDKKIPILAASGLIFNLAFNLMLIPLYKHVGAAIVTSLTEMLLFFIAIVIIPRHLLPTRSIRIGVKAIIAGLVMAVVIWFMREFTIFVILPAAMLVYLIVATLLGTIPREDVQSIYNAIRNKKQRTSPTPLMDQQEADQKSQAGQKLREEEELETTEKLPRISRPDYQSVNKCKRNGHGLSRAPRLVPLVDQAEELRATEKLPIMKKDIISPEVLQ